jgi:hypothetical protein
MRSLVVALLVVLLLGSTAYGGWYVGPRAVYSYYPPVGPVYAYPPPVVVVPPQVVYSPVVPGPVVAPLPARVGAPVVVGPAGKVYIPGRPVRNAIRAVVP